jgi:type VI secretion system protein ImpL
VALSDRLFASVIQNDKAAFSASAAVQSKHAARHAAAAAMLLLIFAAGLTVSFFGNRALENEVLEAARGIPAGEAGGMNLPTQDALQKLETLRQSLVQLTEYQDNGAPLRLRWLLYTGKNLYPVARHLYYERFNQLLFLQTHEKMLASLQGFLCRPRTMRISRLHTLKAYLLTTSEFNAAQNGWLPY